MSTYVCYLWKYRKGIPISQTNLAKAVGVTRQTIYLLEAEKMLPSLELASKIAHVLQMPIEQIFVFTDTHDAFFEENEEMAIRLEEQRLADEFDAWSRSELERFRAEQNKSTG